MTATVWDVIQGQAPPGKIQCPFPDHEDEHPSARYYENGHVHCFGCGRHASDLVDLVHKVMFADSKMGRSAAEGWVRNYRHRLPAAMTAKQAKPKVSLGPSEGALIAMGVFREDSQRNLENNPELVERIRVERGLRDPLAFGLGLTEEWMLRRVRTALARLGFSPPAVTEALFEAGFIWSRERPEWMPGRRLLIPVVRNGNTVFYQARSLAQKPKLKYLNPRCERVLFGREYAERPGPLFIAEGVFDAMPLIEAGHAAIALLGAQPPASMMEELRALCAGRTVAIALDSDETGQREGEALARELGGMYLPAPPPHKDWGEWISCDGVESAVAQALWRMQ